ncbi:MAG: cupin domain-containing protein [Lachnospiraceae bacterium]|nr:cupin domain-containing protein [Lachnospiraceae bacterium]
MNIILLSGGSGKRLWPLSNEIRSKQFIKLFKNENGTYESMIQRMYRSIKKVDENANIVIATSKSQLSSIFNQIGNDVSVSIEPCRRDTFPAIALSAAYLRDVCHVSEEEPIVVCPVDPYVDESYFTTLITLSEVAKNEKANIVLMGIKPSYPSEKYGYIIPKDESALSDVVAFKEKPSLCTARELIKQGALWNGGVFAFKLGYVIAKMQEITGYSDYASLYENYELQEKISFDYAVLEKEQSIKVQRYDGEWKDLGTWNTLTEAMDESIIGNAVLNETCNNVHVINEINIPVLVMGLNDVVVSASPDGILVSDKEQSSYIKPFVDGFEQKIMYAEKSWGSFRVIDAGDSSMTIKVTLNPGHSMNYHSHKKRDEVWVVISGSGRVVLDSVERPVNVGDVIEMKAGCKHTVIAETKLQIIEVQTGKEINADDKEICNR